MDHLLLPDGTKNFITVTYNAMEYEYYDEKGFLDFPRRRGWTEEDLLGWNNFGNRHDREVESFFQTWLFFGMVIEILRAAGIRAHTEDFLRPGRWGPGHVVNTEILPSMLIEWKTRWPLPRGVSPNCACKSWIDPNQNKCRERVCWKNFPHARDSEAWHVTRQILDRAGMFVDRYCTITTSRNGNASENYVWPVRQEVAASILSLGFSLRAAAISIYDIPRMSDEWGTGSSSLLRDILGRKWCKSDAALVMEDVQIDGQYYIAASRSPSQEYLDVHSGCDWSQCKAKVKKGAYKTKHAPGCHGDPGNCSIYFCYGAQPIDRSVPSPFEKELIRVITADGALKAGDKFDITAVGTPIIMWNENRGKVDIVEYNEVKRLRPAYVAISHVWLDGMGNKYANSIPRCQLSRIQRMVDELPIPGRQKGKSIGFWLDTLCVPVRERFHNEKKWSIQKMREIYGNAAAVLVIDSWLGQITSHAPVPDRCLGLYLSNWQRRLWTFQEGCLAKDLYFRFSDRAEHHRELTKKRMAHDKAMEARGIYAHFCGIVDSKVTFPFTLLKQTVDLLVSGQDSRQDTMWKIYLPLADALGHRQTSKQSDETVCLSTILGLDPGPYLSIHKRDDETEEQVAERRMERFLREIKTFNTGLIFSDYSHMSRKGYRWAPRSLLSARLSTIGAIENQLDGRLRRIGTNLGLVVKYRGTRGKLATLLSSTGDIFISEKGARTQVYYSIQPRPNNGSWNRRTVYGLVFAKIPKPGEESSAMIGSEPTRASDDETGIRFLRYECTAVIRGRSGRAPSGTVALRFYGQKTKWMIM